MISKEHIIEFSAEKFTQLGSKRFTMDDLAAQLGISKKTLYNFFNNKEELVVASITWLIEDYKKKLKYVIATEKDPLSSIILFYKHAFDYLEHFKPSFIFGLRKYYPSAAKIFDDFRKELVYKRVLDLLQKAKDLDIFEKEVNPKLVCDLYFKRVESVTFMRDNMFDTYSKEELLNHFIIFNLKGMTRDDYVNPLF